MGIGWVDEVSLCLNEVTESFLTVRLQFMARLQGKPWDRSTQTSENATLNNNADTFPLHRRFYTDFTHDSVITAVLAAFELPELNEELTPTFASPRRKFKTSQLVPFAARLVVEVLECGSDAKAKQRLVRFLLNDAVMPLGQLPECEKRPDGMGRFDKFVQSQQKSFERAEWGNCTRTDLG